jgi:hypothetical protein
LQRSEGAWRLEFQQLVYSSPTLLRPRRFSVLGEQAILQQLRELTGHEPLARDAERLFARGAIPDGAYVVRDGRWFPELAPEQLKEPDPPPPSAAERAAESEAKDSQTRGVLEELVKRVVSLEDTVREMQESLERALTTLSQAAIAPAAVAPQAAAAAAPAAPAAAPPPTAAAAPAPSPQPTAAAAPEFDKKVINLPPIGALSDLVRGLAGPDASIATGERTDWAHISGTMPVFFAVLQDGDGDEAGSMIFDLEAALRLAGALLMESEEMIESLLEEKVMSDEMLDAASEVCNTLTSAFNKVSGNPHLRSGKMQPFTEARAVQLAGVRKRDDYRYNQGGRLSLVAR